MLVLPLQFMFILNPLQYLVEFLDVGVELVGTIKPTYYSVLTRNQAAEEVEHNNYLIDVTSVTEILTSSYYRPVIIYILKISLLFACLIGIPGYIWYIAVNLTTMAELTAIYNTSCFWAYLFSIILLDESIRAEKIIAIFLSIAGVVIMTLSDSKDNGHFSIVTLMGDLLSCFGALMYGLYQVLYKKLGSPPTPSFLFANTLTGLIGVHTFFFLWIPIPLLHFTGIEIFELPDSGTFGYILLIALAGVFFNASFMLVIALTSPLFCAIGIMLTIPIVAWVDLITINTPITVNTVVGSFCILIAFVLLSWTNIKDEIRKLYS
jgi:drug/metabolite transporter (DMT)-like permease